MIRVFPTLEELAQDAAKLICQVAGERIQKSGRCTIALSGGQTPKTLYNFLASDLYRDRINWSQVEIFFSDERSVPPDHADSNYRMAWELMLSRLPMAKGQIHRMKAEQTDLSAAAADYQVEIANRFGISPEGPPPSLDIIILGMGGDGHTASLFPGTEVLQENQKWVSVGQGGSPKSGRMTLTVPLLNAAKQILFLVSGSEKESALKSVLAEEGDPFRYPARLIRPNSGELIWFVDVKAMDEDSQGREK